MDVYLHSGSESVGCGYYARVGADAFVWVQRHPCASDANYRGTCDHASRDVVDACREDIVSEAQTKLGGSE